MRLIMIVYALLLSFISPAYAQQQCAPTPARHAQKVMAIPYSQGMRPGASPEAYGDTAFYSEMGTGRTFALLPTQTGWTIRVFETPADGDSTDLSQVTPMRGETDPRDIHVQDFAPAANQPPSMDRLFFFSDALKGTGGLRPSGGPLDAASLLKMGMGWLRIEDYGLSNLGSAEQSKISYVKFSACLTWPKTSAEQALENDAAQTNFTAADIKTFAQCGLNENQYELSAAVTPRLLRPDLDGDGKPDLIAQVIAKNSGERGLAICGSARSLAVLSSNDKAALNAGLRPGYIGQMEAWRIEAPRTSPLGYDGEQDWPQTDGDVLLLERVEKEMVALFYQDGALTSQRIYGHVEP